MAASHMYGAATRRPSGRSYKVLAPSAAGSTEYRLRTPRTRKIVKMKMMTAMMTPVSQLACESEDRRASVVMASVVCRSASARMPYDCGPYRLRYHTPSFYCGCGAACPGWWEAGAGNFLGAIAFTSILAS